MYGCLFRDFILLEKINKLGQLGDQVSVNAGFGRHYLIPQGKVLTAAGANVEKREVRMPEGAIRELGEYDIEIHLHTDVNVTVKIIVEAE